MNDPLNICLSCGFCCDGTLIGYVQLDNEELPVLKELMEIEDTNSKGFFLQPCKNYCDGCNIYSQRPKQCDNFNCGFLKSYEQKELGFDSAIEIINLVKQKKVAIGEKLAILDFKLHSKSFHFKMVELKKLLEKKKSKSLLTQNHLELMTDLEQLNDIMSQKFGVSLY